MQDEGRDKAGTKYGNLTIDFMYWLFNITFISGIYVIPAKCTASLCQCHGHGQQYQPFKPEPGNGHSDLNSHALYVHNIPYTEKALTIMKMTLYELYIIFKKIENTIYRILFVFLLLFCVFTKSWMTMG